MTQLRRNVDHDRSPLYSSSSDKRKRFYLIQINLREFIDHWVGDRVIFENEQVTVPPDRDVVPYTFEIKVEVTTYPRVPINYDLFVKMFMEDQSDLSKRERAYMRLDILFNMKMEIEMCQIVLKKIEAFQRFVKAEACVLTLFPKCIGARMTVERLLPPLPDHSSAIMLVNPHAEYTFETCNTEGSRNAGFTYNTTILMLRDMARLHAGTMALRIRDKTTFKETILPILNLKVNEYKQAPPCERLFKELIMYGLKDVQLPDDQVMALRDSLELSRIYEGFVREDVDETWFALSYSRYCMSYIMANTSSSPKNRSASTQLVDYYRFRYDHCCKDLASFIFTSVRPESFDEQRSFDNLLEEYFHEFIRTLKRHRKVSTKQYTWDKFISEFNAVGEKSLASIFVNIRTSFCRSYRANGNPILSNEYRKRIKAAVKMMTLFKWIKTSNSDSSETSPEDNLLLLI